MGRSLRSSRTRPADSPHHRAAQGDEVSEHPDSPEQLHRLALRATDRFRTAELVRALAGDHSPSATDWAVRLAEDLAGVLAPDAWRPLARQIAWRLAKRPSTVALRPHFASHAPVSLDDPGTEFRACLLHEMALRFGFHHPRHDEVPLAYGAALRDLGHPLSWLPLNSYRFEQSMRLCSGSDGGAVGSDGPERLRATHPEIPATDKLDAECLDGTTRETVFTFHTTADDLAADLFLAGFAGGWYGEPQYGAYARLHTWQSLYAVLDAGPDTPHREVVRQVADWRWVRFAMPRYTDNRWFSRDFTDTAVAALDPTRTRLGVLAASETD
ncbi:DUF6183 family protein [Streptomyces sp. NPDC020192]|uniref:DUF6183 family protein n=1 Tax=Streptomyces sp. NPDC020192 TaxID=3365066 RepID=UPI00379B5A7C